MPVIVFTIMGAVLDGEPRPAQQIGHTGRVTGLAGDSMRSAPGAAPPGHRLRRPGGDLRRGSG
jgi:hypothetical protein